MHKTEPQIEIIEGLDRKSLITVTYSTGNTDVPWHTHAETEIVYINEGYGTGIIGDKLIRYSPGDLFFIGGYLPHSFRSDSENIGGDNIHFIVQFNPKLLNDELLSLDEWKNISRLKKQLCHGIYIKGDLAKLISDKLKTIPQEQSLLNCLKLYESLEITACATHEKVSSISYSNNYHENSRIGKIMNYLMLHFDNEISIDEMAEMVNLSKPAFCNYFKRMVKKRFSEFLNELRINRACTLLSQTDLTISEICYRCGFTNLSYFNRIFLKQKNTSPLKFRKTTAK